jgi:hypothetical protein
MARRTLTNEPPDPSNAFLELARRRFRSAAAAEATLRQEMLDDLKFVRGGKHQWPDRIYELRSADDKPCLSVNLFPSSIRQVTNQIRQSRPAIKVGPSDDVADVETADIIEGMVRYIERKSDADVVYNTGGEAMARTGRGYARVVTQYVNDESDDQEIRLKRIRNPFTVYFDPACSEIDYSDARYAFITDDVPEDEYDARYGDNASRGVKGLLEGVGNTFRDDWKPEGKLRVAEYFYFEEETKTRHTIELVGGVRVRVFDDELTQARLEDPEGMGRAQILVTREVTIRQLKWAKINGVEVLEGNDAKTEGMARDGRYIPIVPCIADEIDVDGEIDLRGMVRDGRSPQQQLNYWRSALTEIIALAPKSPWVAEIGQIKQFFDMWKNANREAYPVLPYEAKSIEGTPLPPPQRQTAEPPIQAMALATNAAMNDFKAVVGVFYDPSLQERSPEEWSGRAILARQQQSEMGNSNYLDGVGRMIRQLGRIIVDLLPYVYDAPRITQILGADQNEAKRVMVYAGADKAPDQGQLPPGIQKAYNLKQGYYDVTISVGPSFKTQRDEAAAVLMDFVKVVPQAGPIIGDLMAMVVDGPATVMSEISERLKQWAISQGLLPPDDVEIEALPAEAQAAIRQLQAMLSQVTKALEIAKREIETEQAKYDAQAAIKRDELSVRKEIEAMKQLAANARELAKMESQQAIEMLRTEQTRLENLLERTQQVRLAREQAEMADEAAEAEAKRQLAASQAAGGGQPTGSPTPGP